MIELKPYIHHGKELEEAVIGICMLEKLAFGRIYGTLKPEMFYVTGHQVVFKALTEMYEASAPIDLLTVQEWLVNRSGVENINGDEIGYYLTKLTHTVVSSAHLEYHSHLIRQMWERREVLRIKYSDIGDERDPHRMMDQMNEQIRNLLSGEVKRDWYRMDEIMYDLMIHQSEMHKGNKSFITTGFSPVDRMNGGYAGGQMIVIGARPSVGKSAFMGQMALQMARAGKKVGVISLEMNNVEIAARLAAIETQIDFSTIYRDIMKDEALHKRFYDQISKSTIHLPIYLSDKTKVNVNEIRAKAAKLKASIGCDIIMVDYLQLIDTAVENRNYNREQEVARMSRGLKLMAMEIDIPVIVLAQLNRQSTSRTGDKRYPQLSDLRESGAIEQDADVVMFVHRDWMAGYTQDEQGNSTENNADLICQKWRNGRTFHLELGFDGAKMRFYDKETGPGNWKPVSNFYEKEKDDSPF